MRKIQLGDIFEINTPNGNAYLHYIYDEAGIQLIRVLHGLYSERPANLALVAESRERYMIFFPLAAASKRKIVEPVGYYPTNNFTKPKYMRTQHNIRGEFLGWHIVNTNTLYRELVKELTPEHKKLSDWTMWNDTLLIENLVNDWSLEKWG
jgi:hypothetical protein